MPNGLPSVEAALDAVIFDFDGVIVESTDIKTEAFRALFADRPDHLDAIVALHVRHGGVDRRVKFEMIYRDILRLPLDGARKAELAQRFETLVAERVIACPMVAGAAEALEALAARLPLAIVSGTPEAELTHIVARRGLGAYFRAVRGSPHGKEKAVRELLTAQDWRAERVALVGDAMTDFDAAQANGLAFVGRVAPGQASPFPDGTVLVRDLATLEKALASLYSTTDEKE